MAPKVTITEESWRLITREAQQSLDGLETGGILLGQDSGAIISILHAGDPGSRALRGPLSFVRDLDHARRLAAYAWDLDGSQWVGEWHTHVNAAPVPSDVDLESYHRHLCDRELQFRRFVSIIVSLQSANAVAATWLVTRQQAEAARIWVVPDGATSTEVPRIARAQSED